MKFQSSVFTKIKLQIIPLILTATLVLLNSTPAVGHEDGEANKLYVEANQLYESAWQAENYSEALALYKKALTNLETIISKYSSSNVAVEVVKENTINELKYEILPWAILRADAEKSPFACAFYLIKIWSTGGDDPTDEFDELSTVATKYANIGQKDKALKILDEPLSRGRALGILATRYAEIGEFEQALKIVGRKGWLIPLPTNHAELGQLDRALKIVRAIDSESHKGARVEALVEIAGGYARLGQENKAEETYAEALSIARRGGRWVDSKTQDLLTIASKYVELGERNKALEVLGEAFKAAKLLVSPGDYMVQIVIEHAKLGQFEQALEVVKAIDPNYPSTSPNEIRALVEIAGGYAELGQENKAAALFEEIINVTDVKGGKAWVLTQVATKYAKLGQKDQALGILDEVMALDVPPDSNELLDEIVSKYAELGLPDKALGIAKKSGLGWWTFGDIVVKYAQLGELEKVHDILLEMRYKKWFQALEYLLHKLATTWAELGKFEQAFQMVEQLSSGLHKAKNLMEIDLAYAQLGQEIKKDQKDILNKIVRDTHWK